MVISWLAQAAMVALGKICLAETLCRNLHLLRERHILSTGHILVSIVGCLDAIADGISQAARLDYITGSKYTRQDGLVLAGNQPAATELLDGLIIREIIQHRLLTDGHNNLIRRDESAIVGIDAFLGNLISKERPYQLAAAALYILNLILKGSRLLHIYSHYGLCAHVVCRTAGIHAGVAAADNYYPLAHLRIFTCIDLLQEIQSHGQAFLALPVEEAGLVTAGSNYHRIIVLLDFSKLRLVHLAGGDELHADILDALQLADQHIVHQAAARDNLLQLAADMLRIVIDSNSMSLAPQLPCRRQACHTAADDADFLAGLSSWRSNLLVGRQPAQVANLDRLVDTATGTAIHTWIRADTAADRTRERSILQLQVNSFLQLALTDEVITLLGRNAGRAAELARSVVLGIVPARYAQSIQSIGNSIVNSEIVHGNIAEDTALYPLIGTEILHGHLAAWLGSLFLKGKRTQLLPLAPVGKLSLQLGALDFLQELIHAASQKVNILLLQIQVADIGRIAADRAADINHAAYHANTGTLTQHGGKLIAVIAADNGTAAAHELKGERAGIFQNPQLRLLIERVMLHQRTAAGTGTAADKDLAPGGAVAGSITGIATNGNHTAGIQPAYISRGGILYKNLGIRQAHGAHALTGIGHMENQLLAISIPQRAADVMLT